MKRTFWATFQSAINRNVKKGIAFLDKILPNWEDKIDLNELDLSDAEICICGQLDIDNNTFILISFDPNFGFNIPRFSWTDDEKQRLAYKRLTQLWKQAITLRQTAKATQVSSSSEIISQFTT